MRVGLGVLLQPTTDQFHTQQRAHVQLIIASHIVAVDQSKHLVPSSALPPDGQLLSPLGKPPLRITPVLEYLPTDGQGGGRTRNHTVGEGLLCALQQKRDPVASVSIQHI